MRAIRPSLIALAIMVCGLSQSQASIVIFNTMPTNPAAEPETLLGRSILNILTVGPANVEISGFGTFGRLNEAGNLKWVIFGNTEGSSPLFSTAPIAATASPDNIWYDSPAISFTLLANTTYQLGLMSDQFFTYNWDFPGVTVSQGGLTQLQFDDINDSNGNAFEFGSPVLGGGGAVVNSLRVFAVPEPSSVASLLGGGVCLAFGVWRRRRQG